MSTNPNTANEYLPVVTSKETQPNWLRRQLQKKYGKAVVITTTLLATGGIITGTAAAINASEHSITTSQGHNNGGNGGGSGTETTPTPEKTANPDVFTRTDPLPSALAPLKSMSFELISAQPNKLAYAEWLDQYKATYMSRYAFISGDKSVEINLTTSSRPQDVFRAYLNVMNMASSMDNNDAAQYLAAHGDGTVDTNPSISAAISNRQDQYLKQGDKVIAKKGDPISVDWLAVGSLVDKDYENVSLSTANTINLEGKQALDTTIVTYTNRADGLTYKLPLYVETVTSYNSQPVTDVIYGPNEQVTN